MKMFLDSTPFLRANFHCHTTNSDGRMNPEDCIRFYKNAGYKILSITDHRMVTEMESEEILLIPGIEIDYILPGQWVHILGLGMKKEIEDRWNPSNTPQDGINLIRQLGGIAVLGHPAWSLNTPDFMRSLEGLSGVEIWNSVSTLPINGDRADSSSLLDVTWASGGELLPVFANDDSHSYTFEAGIAATMVQPEECSVESVMEALRKGRFYATTGPQIQQIEYKKNGEIIVRCSPADTIIFYSDSPWSNGRVVIRENMTECSYNVQELDHYVRIEVRDKAGRRAWSSPVKVK